MKDEQDVVSGGETEIKQARRVRLFGRTVASLDPAEILSWLRSFANAHPNPASESAVEARLWQAELEDADSEEGL